MINITAGGGVLFRISRKGHIKVLLIHRRGFWDIPKGKQEPDESIAHCAAREVMEEIGLQHLPMILAPLGTTEHEYEERGHAYHKTTHWFVMYTHERDFVPQLAEQIDQVKWKKLDEAFSVVKFDTLRQVLDRFRSFYLGG